jgi:hypothetical protein
MTALVIPARSSLPDTKAAGGGLVHWFTALELARLPP